MMPDMACYLLGDQMIQWLPKPLQRDLPSPRPFSVQLILLSALHTGGQRSPNAPKFV